MGVGGCGVGGCGEHQIVRVVKMRGVEEVQM